MGVVLPDALAFVLNMIGVDWPNIDEDDLRSGADELRQLSSELTSNTGDAKGQIEQLLSANSSASLDRFNALWQKLASGHLPQLAEGLNLVATGLDASAVLVTGMKLGAIVQLGILAAEIIADQAAAPFTFGASEAAIPAEVEITSQVVKQVFKKVAEQVEQALLSALEGPIFEALGNAAMELGGQLLDDALGTGSGVNLGDVAGAADKGLGSGVTGEVDDPGSVLGFGGPGGSSGSDGSDGSDSGGDQEDTPQDAGDGAGDSGSDGTDTGTGLPHMGPGLVIGPDQPDGNGDQFQPRGLEQSMPVEPEGTEEVSRPVEREGTEEVSRPVEPEGTEEVSRPVEPEGTEEASRPVEQEGTEEVSRPVEPEGTEEVSRPVESDRGLEQSLPVEAPRSEQFQPLQPMSPITARLGPGIEIAPQTTDQTSDQFQPVTSGSPRMGPGIKVGGGQT
jgi:hypothetical protein